MDIFQADNTRQMFLIRTFFLENRRTIKMIRTENPDLHHPGSLSAAFFIRPSAVIRCFCYKHIHGQINIPLHLPLQH